jgi:hypothetical protein
MDGHFNVFGPEAVEWENLKDKAVQVIKAWISSIIVKNPIVPIYA